MSPEQILKYVYGPNETPPYVIIQRFSVPYLRTAANDRDEDLDCEFLRPPSGTVPKRTAPVSL